MQIKPGQEVIVDLSPRGETSRKATVRTILSDDDVNDMRVMIPKAVGPPRILEVQSHRVSQLETT